MEENLSNFDAKTFFVSTLFRRYFDGDRFLPETPELWTDSKLHCWGGRPSQRRDSGDNNSPDLIYWNDLNFVDVKGGVVQEKVS